MRSAVPVLLGTLVPRVVVSLFDWCWIRAAQTHLFYIRLFLYEFIIFLGQLCELTSLGKASTCSAGKIYTD